MFFSPFFPPIDCNLSWPARSQSSRRSWSCSFQVSSFKEKSTPIVALQSKFVNIWKIFQHHENINLSFGFPYFFASLNFAVSFSYCTHKIIIRLCTRVICIWPECWHHPTCWPSADFARLYLFCIFLLNMEMLVPKIQSSKMSHKICGFQKYRTLYTKCQYWFFLKNLPNSRWITSLFSCTKYHSAQQW